MPAPSVPAGLSLAALPRCCLLCRQWGHRALCLACLARFAPPLPRCVRCGLLLPSAVRGNTTCGACLHQPPPFSHTLVVADYGFPWDRLVADLKFRSRPELAGALAGVLADAVARSAAPPVNLVLPVPLSSARLAERGYNQAWELARRLARTLHLPTSPQALQRLRDTPHQVGLPRTQRLRNMADAFWVPPEQAPALHGREVALVDDVMTTGVTAAAASQALLAAGVAGVQVWVLARTAVPDD